MSAPLSRRTFVASGLAAELTFLGALPSLTADDVKTDPKLVRLNPDIEPLVRLIEDTPRGRLLEEVGQRIRKGTTYQELLAALMLAGVRGIQPRPVGFKFHAVLVVNSAHLATQAAEDRDRWLPLFWALDYFKGSQARNKEQGDWHMAPVEEARVPPAHRARQAFVEAMDAWDEAAVDVAVAGLVRHFGANEVIEHFWRYGARDFRDIGHKAIYVANAWRSLQTIGWRHAEPVVRSLAYALLEHSREPNPAKNSLAPDLPGRDNLERIKKIRKEWKEGKPSEAATKDLLATLRHADATGASETTMNLLQRGVAPASVWDGLFLSAGELALRQPGIVGMHCVTSANALHYAFQTAQDDDTRKFVTLQAAAFLSMFRKFMAPKSDLKLDRIERAAVKEARDIFVRLPKESDQAALEVLGYLGQGGSAEHFMAEARRLIFLKGTDSHDYKFSSAILEDYYHVSPAWRNLFLASSVSNLRGSGGKDNGVVQRTRAALQG